MSPPRRLWLPLLPVLFLGCGGGSNLASTAPTPVTAAPTTPVVNGITVRGTLTDTVTGAAIGTFSEVVARLPARITLTAAGHFARTTTVRVQGESIDLIPEAGFDLELYRQFARDALENAAQPLQILTQDVSFYVQVEGTQLPAQLAAQLQPVAQRIVADLTGGRLHVLRWETGTTPRPVQPGWIIVERSDEETNVCGRALLGAAAGHIWLDSNRSCNVSATFAHEIGHALGFSHVNRPGSMMLPEQPGANLNDAPTEIERRLGAIAYKRTRGNRDIDVDP